MTEQDLALLLRVAALRGTGTDPKKLMDVIRDECTLDNPTPLQREVSVARLTQLTARRDNEDTQRPALDQEISDLEGLP